MESPGGEAVRECNPPRFIGQKLRRVLVELERDLVESSVAIVGTQWLEIGRCGVAALIGGEVAWLWQKHNL